MTIKLEQLLGPDSRLFAKSEFGPAHQGWPALSFSSNKIARDFHRVARQGRDFVVWVGTSNPKDTSDPLHRQRLMSVVDIQPLGIIRTEELVSPELWKEAQAKYPGRWDVSLPIARAWEVQNFPKAAEKIPLTYAKFQNPGTRGHPIPVEIEDYERLKGIELVETQLVLARRANQILDLNVNDSHLRAEFSRLAAAIRQDVENSLKTYSAAHPVRKAPDFSQLFLNISNAWKQQEGKCALCQMPILLKPKNKLLQMSRDRIDSAIKDYDASNLHLTHLGCNLAKSDATIEEWNEFRQMLRS